MNRTLMFCSLGTVLAVASLGFAAEPAVSADETTIRQVLTDRNDAWGREDVAALTAGFTADADYINSTGKYLSGRENLKTMYESLFASGKFKDAKIDQAVTRVRLVTPNTALVDATWSYTLAGPDATSKSGSSFLVMHKVDEKWQISALRVAATSANE